MQVTRSGDAAARAADLLAEAQALSPALVAIRRDLHRHPELGFDEVRTAARVARQLQQLGVEVREGVGKTGVVGLLAGEPAGGRVIAVRAEMDALPIQEEGVAEYRSEVPGRMHACGHDAHVACTLGAAMLLTRRRGRLAGAVKFLFQPSEEPGGGAEAMIADGVLRQPSVDAIIALHTYPGLEAGRVGVGQGPLMARADRLHITIRGEGGHAAEPHRTIDPVVIGAAVVLQLQTVVSRSVDPLEAAVVTIGSMQAGSSPYVIPSVCELTGTVRSVTPEVGSEMIRLVRRVTEKTAEAHGASASVEVEQVCPAVVNDPEVTAVLRRAAGRLLGDHAVATARPTMAAEDFGCYLATVPGSFFWLGVAGKADGVAMPWHHPRFDIDEAALGVGAATLAATCLEYLEASP